MEEPHPVKSKELFPALFGRHALAYQQRIEQVMERGEARGRLRVLELVDVHIPNARFEVMDIERLTFADAYFDAAVCGHGIQFAPDLAVALSEARRVLRSGARFAASVPVEGNNESVWALLETVIDRWLPPDAHAVDQGSTRAALADTTRFREAALEAGFATAKVEVIQEHVIWGSAEQLVSLFTSWWSCASRLDGVDDERRRGFTEEAILFAVA